MTYSIEELKTKIEPIARKYAIPAVWVFGSYARGDANDESDVDLLIDSRTPALRNLFDLGGLYDELNRSFDKRLDIVQLESLSTDEAWAHSPWFIRNVYDERVKVYEAV
ncbi:MAG: nucleotidyltransferase domain-containing protein [Clostridia bacterium]|nr:nucleotidyltransferase domain-containing protein [Clostridia bacterium]